jgi:hypothetical protein
MGRSPGTVHRRAEWLVAGLVLCCAILVLLGRAWLPGYVLSAADGVFATPFYSAGAPIGFDQPSNPLLFDQVYQFAPWHFLAWQALHSGHLPLWNPDSYTGSPLLATMQVSAFYPLHLIFWLLLPFPYTMVWVAGLNLLIAGLFTFALCRNYGLGWAPAMIAAMAFMLSGYLIAWLGHPQANVAVWLPALIFAADRLATAPSRSARVRAIVFLALVTGLQFAGGHIETSVDTLTTTGLYYFVRWTQVTRAQPMSWPSRLGRLLVALIPVGLGTALAAAQLVPFFEWLQLSSIAQARRGGGFNLTLVSADTLRQLFTLGALVFPNLYNNPSWRYPYWSFLLNWDNYNGMAVYVGAATLALAIVAVASARGLQRSLIWLWAGIGLLSLGRALNLPFFGWINQLPLLRLTLPDRLRLVVSFSLAILGGFGADRLLSPDASISRPARRRMLWLCSGVVVAGIVMMAGSQLVIPRIKDRVVAYGRILVEAQYAQRSTHSKSLEQYYAQVDGMVAGLQAAFDPRNLAQYAPALSALATVGLLIAERRLRGRPRSLDALVGPILLSCITADLLVAGHGYNPAIPIDQFFPATPLTRAVGHDAGLFRLTALRQDLVPDAQAIYGLPDVRGLDFTTLWYEQYVQLVPSRIPWLPYGVIFASADSPLLRVLNLKYVAAADLTQLTAQAGFANVKQFGDIYLGELASVVPRAFMVYSATVTRDDAQTLQLLRETPEAVFTRVLLSTPAAGHPPPLLGLVPNSKSAVKLVQYAAETSTWQVQTDQPGYLFLGDAFYPGWNAYIDDKLVDLYRANEAFRAVWVPAGEHQVSFRYEPVSLRLGSVISGLALLVVLGLAVWALRAAAPAAGSA